MRERKYHLMEDLAKELQNLPQAKPDEDFISILESRLIGKHLENNRGKLQKSWFLIPSFTLGSVFIIIFVISGMMIWSHFNPGLKTTDVGLANNQSKDLSGLEESKETETTAQNKSGCSCLQDKVEETIIVEGLLEKSESSNYPYQLKLKGEDEVYLLKGEENFESYLGQEIEIQGVLSSEREASYFIFQVENLKQKE